jgi:hypothetical protein
METTIWVLVLFALPIGMYFYERKRHQEYLAELEILDEPYKRLLDAGVLSVPSNDRHGNRS